MGRKLNLGQLTEDEEKRILEVIQKDYELRKVETSRIGKLSKDIESEEAKQQEVVKGAVHEDVPIDTLCARCGSKFMWLINPKDKCTGCDLYFCRNKIDCIVYDKITKNTFCNACIKQRDLQSYSGEWFYSKLKGKFRRHGGAKVSRELKKRRSRTGSESSEPPPKPPRLGLNDEKTVSPTSSHCSSPQSLRRQDSAKTKDQESNGVSMTIEKTPLVEDVIRQEYDVQMDAVVIETSHTLLESAPPPVAKVESNDIEIQTDDLELSSTTESNLPTIKEELEEAIKTLLVPKLEELKNERRETDQLDEAERQRKMEDAVKLAEEMIDQALERAKEKHAKSNEGENILMEKYLIDSKNQLMQRVTSEFTEEQMLVESFSSTRSSQKEAGTMTETSDSELDSIESNSARKKNVPLSERLGSLSPDSLRNTLNNSQGSSSRSSITQGVVLQKDQLVARAEMDQAVAQILDAQGVDVHGPHSPQEFSTELTFTAVGAPIRPTGYHRSSSESSDSDNEEKRKSLLAQDENWVRPEAEMKPAVLRNVLKPGNTNSSNSMMSIENDVKSPYDHVGADSSDSDDREHVEEEEVQASIVRRPADTVSALSLVSQKVEVVDRAYLPEKKQHLSVDVAVDPAVIDSFSKDIDENPIHRKEPEKPTTPPIEEEIIEAVEKKGQEFTEGPAAVEVEEIEVVQEDPTPIPVKRSGRTSADSAYHSDHHSFSPPSSESELSVIPEASQEDRSSIDHNHHTTSEDDSTDTESDDSIKLEKSQLLQPERYEVTHEESTVTSHLTSDSELMADDDHLGDKMAEVLAHQAARYEPEQQEVTVDVSMSTVSTVNESHDVRASLTSMSSMSDEDSHDGAESDDNSVTPTREEEQVDESAVAMRMVTTKSIDVLADAIQNIEEVKGHESDSSESSKTYSANSTPSPSAEEVHQLNEAEEKIYVNAARTFAMHEHVEHLEEEVTTLQRFDQDGARLKQLEVQVQHAEREVESISSGGNSIDEIMRKLRGAGLQVEKGGFKRSSLEAIQKDGKKVTRHTINFPPTSPNQEPVNAIKGEPSWKRHSFTVIPASRVSIVKLRDPTSESAENMKSPRKESLSSHSDVRSRSSTSSKSSIHESGNEEESETLAPKAALTLMAPLNQSTPKHVETVTHTTSVEKVETRSLSRSSSSASESSVDSVGNGDEKSNYIAGVVVDHQEVLSPRPVPRQRKEMVSQDEATIAPIVLTIKEPEEPKSAPREEEAIDVEKIVEEYRRKRNSASESGSEYTGPISSHEEGSESESEGEKRKRREYALRIAGEAPETPEILSQSETQTEKEEVVEIPAAVVREEPEHHKLTSSSESESEHEEQTEIPAAVVREEPEHHKLESSSDSESEHEEQIEIPAAIVRKEPEDHKLESSSESESEHEEQIEIPLAVVRAEVQEHEPRSRSESENEEERIEPVARTSTKQRSHTSSSSSESGSEGDIQMAGTAKSTRRVPFGELSPEEQREMARIALLHLPETVIETDDRPDQYVRLVNVVRSPDQEVAPSQFQEVAPVHTQHQEVTPVHTHRKEVIPVQARHEELTPVLTQHQEVIKVHHEKEVTPVHSDHEEVSPVHTPKKVIPVQSAESPKQSTGVAKKRQELLAALSDSPPYKAHNYKDNGWKGTTFNTDKEKANLRHSYDGSKTWKVDKPDVNRNSMSAMETSPQDNDHSTNARGSITIRGGKKMVLTTSPQAKPEFQSIQE